MKQHKSRRQIIGLAAGLAGLGLAASPPAKAAPSLSKAAAGYRDIPYNGQVCAQCVFFVFRPMADGQPQSRCQMVAGNINPAGWCEIWAPKT